MWGEGVHKDSNSSKKNNRKNKMNGKSDKGWERGRAVQAERPVSAGHSVVAGLGTSVVSVLVSHPFELVRAREQAKQLARSGALLHTAPPQQSHQQQQRPSLAALCVADLRELRAIVREEGVAGLYRGAGTHLFGHVTSGMVFFAAQALLQARADALLGTAGQGALGRVARRVLVSSLAGCVQVCATHPVWVVKGRQQLQRRDRAVQRLRAQNSIPARLSSALSSFLSPFVGKTQNKQSKSKDKDSKNLGLCETVARWARKTTAGRVVALARREGVAGLYAGLVPSLLLTVHTAVQYAAYDELKSAIAVHVRHGRPLTTADRVLASLAVRGTAAVVGNPASVVRTRLMQKRSPYRGVRDCVARVVRDEGVATLFRGTSAALWRVLAAGITMPCYDYVATRTKKYFVH